MNKVAGAAVLLSVLKLASYNCYGVTIHEQEWVSSNYPCCVGVVNETAEHGVTLQSASDDFSAPVVEECIPSKDSQGKVHSEDGNAVEAKMQGNSMVAVIGCPAYTFARGSADAAISISGGAAVAGVLATPLIFFPPTSAVGGAIAYPCFKIAGVFFSVYKIMNEIDKRGDTVDPKHWWGGPSYVVGDRPGRTAYLRINSKDRTSIELPINLSVKEDGNDVEFNASIATGRIKYDPKAPGVQIVEPIHNFKVIENNASIQVIENENFRVEYHRSSIQNFPTEIKLKDGEIKKLEPHYGHIVVKDKNSKTVSNI